MRKAENTDSKPVYTAAADKEFNNKLLGLQVQGDVVESKSVIKC